MVEDGVIPEAAVCGDVEVRAPLLIIQRLLPFMESERGVERFGPFTEGQREALTFATVYGHSYWLWNRQLSSTPGVWTVSILVNGVLVRSETVTAI